MADFIYNLSEFRLYVFLFLVYDNVVVLYYTIELIMLVLQFTFTQQNLSAWKLAMTPGCVSCL